MIRQATTDDRDALHELYRAFDDEMPERPAYLSHTIESELNEVDEMLADGLAFVADEDGELVGFALGRLRENGRGLLSDIYVRPEARQRGLATSLTTALVPALRERGATWISLNVEPGNARAKGVYERWGFEYLGETMSASIADLDRRLTGSKVAE